MVIIYLVTIIFSIEKDRFANGYWHEFFRFLNVFYSPDFYAFILLLMPIIYFMSIKTNARGGREKWGSEICSVKLCAIETQQVTTLQLRLFGSTTIVKQRSHQSIG
jgi:hypothetical protein